MLTAAVAALVIGEIGVPVNSVLAAAGLVGGAISTFVLPVLAEPDPDRRRGRAAVAIAATTLAVVQPVLAGTSTLLVVLAAIPSGAALFARAGPATAHCGSAVVAGRATRVRLRPSVQRG